MAVRTLPGRRGSARAAAHERPVLLAAAGVLALGLPLIFLHIDWQPKLTLTVGSTSGQLDLSDFAVLASALAGLVAGIAHGFAPLRHGRWIWIAGAAFLLMILLATFYPLLSDRAYDWHTHLVTAAKFWEYALLALAAPLIVRSRRELQLVLAALVVWSVPATVLGIAQFLGWDVLDAFSAGRRQPSFLGHHDFAALSAGSLSVALAALVLPFWRISRGFAALAGVSGGLGLILSGSTAGLVGVGVGAFAALLAGRLRGTLSVRRLVGTLAVVGVVAAGILALRGGDFDQFLRYVGIRKHEQSTSENVQTYVQHSLLAYIGLKIWLGHPIAGVGWQGSGEESGYRPYLDDAHAHFPHASPLSFPSPEHAWGVQNGYVQALADLGAIGFLLFAAFLFAVLWTAARPALRAPPEAAAAAVLAGLWLLAAMGVWGAVGLVAGIPLDALVWLAAGLAVVSRTIDA